MHAQHRARRENGKMNAVHVQCAIRKHEATAEQAQERERQAVAPQITNQAERQATENPRPRRKRRDLPSQQATAHQSRRESPRTRGGISHPVLHLGSSALPPPVLRSSSPCPHRVHTLGIRPRPRTQIRRLATMATRRRMLLKVIILGDSGCGRLPFPLSIPLPFFCLSVRLLL